MPDRSSFRYRHFGNRLVCVDQGAWQLIQNLVLAHRRNGIQGIGISVADTAMALVMLVRFQLSGGSKTPLEFPVFGNVAIKVHKGYKFFDFAQSTVTKLFANDISEIEASEQIHACERASKVDAAPRFLDADPERAWYKEEYTPGTHGTETDAAVQGRFMDFYPDVEKCLLDLIGAEAPKQVDVASYIDDLTASALFELWDEASDAQETVREVRHYQQELKRWLLNNLAAKELQLVLIHGDFSLVNVIVAKDRFRVIDWEGIRYGNLFGDCFNFVFAEKYYDRAKGDVTVEMTRVFEHFARSALGRYPGLEASIDIPMAFALRLYYLERLKLMLERDVSINLMSVIRKSVRMFREYDIAAALPALEEG